MSDAQTTETVSANPSVAEADPRSQQACLNGKAVPHSDDEAITYDPVPLRLERTITAHLKPIGKLPIAPWPEEE